MGYSTQYKGKLEISPPLDIPRLVALDAILGEDPRDHPEWGNQEFYGVDLELTKDKKFLQWNHTEKSYSLDKQAELVIREMRKQFPDFCLSGRIRAQGEEMDDRWAFVIVDDKAVVTKLE